jgi:hypothetical protein
VDIRWAEGAAQRIDATEINIQYRYSHHQETGSLSPDSHRARRMPATEALGQERSVAARSWPDSEAGQAF